MTTLSSLGRTRRALLKTAALVGLALAAASRPLAAAELTEIRITEPPTLPWTNGWELFDVADVKGFFEAERLKLVRVPLPPEQHTTAIDAGLTDFAGYADYAYFANVKDKDKGLDVKEIAATSLLIAPEIGGDGLFVPENSPIRSAEDLRGKTVGMTNLSWSSAWFTLDYLGSKGITKDEVTYLAVPPAQQEQLLLRGDIDALYAFGPLDAQLKKKGGYRQLFKLSDISGRAIVRGGTMAKREFIEKKPETVKKFTAAIAKAADWANANPAEVVKIEIDLGHVDPELAPWVYTNDGRGDYSVLRWAEHALQNEADVKFWLDLVERQGIVPAGKHQAADLFTNQYNPFVGKTAAK